VKLELGVEILLKRNKKGKKAVIINVMQVWRNAEVQLPPIPAVSHAESLFSAHDRSLDF
jgi:hypothetical protein